MTPQVSSGFHDLQCTHRGIHVAHNIFLLNLKQWTPDKTDPEDTKASDKLLTLLFFFFFFSFYKNLFFFFFPDLIWALQGSRMNWAQKSDL